MLGVGAGAAVALIFYLRMRIEEMGGKAASRQASLGGFETEDVLYLLPLRHAVQRHRALPDRGVDRCAAVRGLGASRLPPGSAR